MMMHGWYIAPGSMPKVDHGKLFGLILDVKLKRKGDV